MKNFVWESTVGEHFDATFFDSFARKSDTRASVEEKTT